MTRVLMVHGWALGPWIWQPLVDALSLSAPHCEFRRVDLGFWGALQEQAGDYDLAIGHSLGLLWLLNSDKHRFRKLIAINGFTRFARNERFRQGIPGRVIDRMKANLGREPLAQLTAFWDNSGLPPSDRPADEGDFQQLNWGLDALKTWDGREQWSQALADLEDWMVVAATGDRIVPAGLTRACFTSGGIQWIDSDSHLLPLSEPQQCASLLLPLIET